MVAFNHIADDAGVMLLLLDVMYLGCIMLIGYHYYCQKKIIFISLYVESQLLSIVSMCVCARCCRSDGTQLDLTMPMRECLNS